ncbi:Acyl-protein thioesterase 1 [Tolypocladium paradoxum]|uniref:Acyl-protein thioesterase 1 n=1 Tax=Tolypocladium paradoxum TaxID=94208 RepID=A0A2S4KLE1_9HYPO|nr:Acyl-protein thioesterase 1 [Tolypocladium paradoxum]
MENDTASPAPEANSFGAVYVLEPNAQHTHTAVLLHGRGSSGEEFAQELLESPLSGQVTLAQKLAGWRLVFPSSRELWSTVFEEEMPAWFEAHSLTDVTARQDLQMGGIRESVKYLTTVLDEEIDRLGGRAENLILGGISQGGAIGMWTLLCSAYRGRHLGGFVGASTWLPFAENVMHYLGRATNAKEDPTAEVATSDADAFVESMMAPLKRSLADPGGSALVHATPVFLGHGTDDAYVDIELGRQARHVLTSVGLKVEWREYAGAEQEGHWFKVPDEVDDMADFFTMVASSSASTG